MIRGLLLLSASSACLAASVAKAQVSPAAFTTYTRYDTMGRVVGTIGIDPDGAGALKHPAKRTTYDAQGRVASVETGYLDAWPGDTAPAQWTGFQGGARTDYTYDADGNKIREVVSGNGQQTITDFSYDGIDRVRCVAQRLNASLSPSSLIDGCTLGTPGAQGPDRITRTSYNALNKPVLIEKAVGTPLQQNYVTYSYDGAGRIMSVTDANGTRAEYRYDSLGRMQRWVFPSKTTANMATESDFEEYSYDANGNRTSLRKRDGVTINYTYDALNRMTVKVVPPTAGCSLSPPVACAPGYSVFYGYDLRGLQLFARFSSTTGSGITNNYDNAGRLLSSTTTMDGTSRTVSWQFDANGNRTRITHPDGAFFNMIYSWADQFTNASWTGPQSSNIPFVGFTYDNFGRQIGRGVASSTTSLSYDGINRLASYTHNFAAGAGNVTTTLGYNPASQITSEARSSSDYVWTGGVDVARNYTVNGLNQYLTAGPASFTYDANGNLTSDGTSSYVYDAENRLVSASSAGGTTLAYDPLGRLWQTNSPNTGITRFVYEGDHVAAEYDGAGAMRRRYFWGPGADEPILQDEGGQLNCSGTRFFHLNHQSSTIAVADCWGNRVATNRYDEYGIPQAGNWGRFQYTGQAWLPELGMYYYKARIYSPTLGRFLQTDPIGYDDQVNLYAYVGNDPVNKTDPTGTETACQASGSCPTLSGKGKDGVEAASLVNRAIRAENSTVSTKINGVNVNVNVGEKGAANISASGKAGPVSFSVNIKGTLNPVDGLKAVNVKIDKITTGGALGDVKSTPNSLMIFQNKSGDLAIKLEGNLVVDVKIPFIKDVTLNDNQVRVVR